MTASKMPTLLALGAVAVITFFSVVVGAAALLDEVSQDTRVSTHRLGAVTAIDLASDEGDVELRTVPAGQEATLRVVEEHGLFGGPDVNLRDEGGRIQADSDCTAFVFGNSCSTRWILGVPEGTPVKVRTGSGDVKLDGTIGTADLRTGSGDVDVRGAEGETLTVDTGSGDITAGGVRVRALDLRTGSGDIELPGLSARTATLDTSSGDIEVRASSPLKALTAETGSGDIELGVPGGPYAVSTSTGSGDENVSVPTDPNAQRSMRLKTGSGDIEVRGR